MKKFSKKIEDFICEHCSLPVKGSGYTNHCPNCLWSKHVDVNPGDRTSTCGGMMEPRRTETVSGNISLIHRCTVCSHEKKNRVAVEDDMDKVAEVARRWSQKLD